MLIAAGADVNNRNNTEKTPLYYAANGCRLNIIEALLRAGADPKDACYTGLERVVNQVHKSMYKHRAIKMGFMCGLMSALIISKVPFSLYVWLFYDLLNKGQ